MRVAAGADQGVIVHGPVPKRIVGARTARQHREERRFAEREIRRVLAEVDLRRLLRAPRTVAVVHAIQVLLEDLLFRQHPLEPAREHHLAQLAGDALAGCVR